MFLSSETITDSTWANKQQRELFYVYGNKAIRAKYVQNKGGSVMNEREVTVLERGFPLNTGVQL